MGDLLPVYEMLLKKGETKLEQNMVRVTTGSSFEIRCRVEDVEETEKETIQLTRDNTIVKDAASSSDSTSLIVGSFENPSHGGVYECAVTRASGIRQRKKLRIGHKAVLLPGMEPCTGPDSCKNGGVCALVDDSVSICVCPDDYVGPRCEDVLVKDVIVTGAKVGATAGVTFNVILIFLALAFGVMYFKERKRRRQLENKQCFPIPCLQVSPPYLKESPFELPYSGKESLPLVKPQKPTVGDEEERGIGRNNALRNRPLLASAEIVDETSPFHGPGPSWNGHILSSPK